MNEALERGPLDLARWHPRIVRLLSMGGTQFSPIAALVSVATRERIDLSDDEVETATLRYRHLITVIGDGVKLTQAGYLPPALVQQLATDLSLVHADWPFPIVRESDTVAVLGLRESATTLGLVRKQHGRLQPTASGRRLTGDPRKLFNHIRTRMPAGRHDYEQDAGLLSLLYAAAGDDFYAQRDEAGAVFGTLGWGSTEPLGWAVWHLSEPTRRVHTNLTGGRTGANAARIAAALLAR